MNRAAAILLLSLPLFGQPLPDGPLEARVPFYGQELIYRYSPAAAPGPAPLLVIADAAWDFWQPAAAARGWSVAALSNLAPAPSDTYAKALETVVADALQRLGGDSPRVYLAGTGRAVPAVFFARGRVPHLWAAAFAALGDPRPAIDSNRLFTANAELVPLLWAGRPEDEAVRVRLHAAGYPFEWREAAQLKPGEETQFLAAHARRPHPPRIDCETGSLAFGRCYWLEIVKADPARRNDVLTRSRVTPGSGASLALGGFGYDPAAPGPGVEVVWLPDNYSGPLKLKDRIVSVGGRKIADGRDYVRFLDETREEKPVAVLVQRGKERMRLETRIALAPREENVTARVRAEWSEETRELLILSRGVAALRVLLPAAWGPAALNWNGQVTGKADAAGCWLADGGWRRCPVP
ncbi:MAG: hypothetical protein HY822_10110 [Acidobacteria bacterium]|nr:hypothetical protein [Acidobacteriota bacterium]